jgi:hypothetical protein
MLKLKIHYGTVTNKESIKVLAISHLCVMGLVHYGTNTTTSDTFCYAAYRQHNYGYAKGAWAVL